jgi:5,10-methylenetetrahydromethanopterin reductase
MAEEVKMGMHVDVKTAISFRREFPQETVMVYAKEAEALGFEELWVVEDCFYASGIAPAAAILASTERMRVGLAIMPVVARNPVFSAMEIATIERMYPGRFIAGVGHGVEGWMRQIGAYPRSPLGAMREGVEIMRGLLAGETLNYDGKQFQLQNGKLVYPPMEEPPIYLGVRGPKSLALSGEIANGTILAEFSSPAYVRWAREQIAKGNTDGKKHNVTVFAYACACETREEGRERLRPLVAKAILSGSKDMYFTSMGVGEELKELQALGEIGAVAQRIPDDWIDQLGIYGQPYDWQVALDAFAKSGADTVVLVPLPELGMGQVKAFAQYLF